MIAASHVAFTLPAGRTSHVRRGIVSIARTPRQIAIDFERRVDELWRNVRNTRPRKPKLGLAISGGVDSMALAHLCAELNRSHPERFAFQAFVVDHRARTGSTDEALQVIQELRRMDVDGNILTLGWPLNMSDDPAASPHFEKLARALRYRALARACHMHRAQALLVAHHADDVSETVLLRMLNGSTGPGLHGISASANIPECEGMYGVDDSGQPFYASTSPATQGFMSSRDSILIERGGIPLLRPLLDHRKEDLKQVCVDEGIRWWEDATNKDVTLTSRNTIRHVQSMDLLPNALRHANLLNTAQTVSDEMAATGRSIDALFARIPVTLDVRNSTVRVSMSNEFRHEITTTLAQDPLRIQAGLVTRITNLLQRAATVKGPAMLRAVEFFFTNDSALAPKYLNFGNLLVHQESVGDDSTIITISCKSPSKTLLSSSMVKALTPVVWEKFAKENPPNLQWTLWSDRYWLTVACSSRSLIEPLQISVRALQPGDLHQLKRGQGLSPQSRRRLDRALKLAPTANIRFSIPALVIRKSSTTYPGKSSEENVVALPSIGWSLPKWIRMGHDGGRSLAQMGEESRENAPIWLWDIRYKDLDGFPHSQLHEVCDSWGFPLPRLSHPPPPPEKKS